MKQVLSAFLLLMVVLVGGLVVTNGSVIKKAGVITAAASNTSVNTGQEKDLSMLSKNIKWDPDGHISYVTFPNGNRRFFISANQRTYTIDSTTPVSLEQALSNKPVIKQNFSPDKNTAYKNAYATITSVVQPDAKNPYHLYAFTQNEQQAVKPDGSLDYATFTASISILESKDGGNTWKDYGPVIKGDDYLMPGSRISGAGEPCAIINNGYVYIYFVDWAAGTKTSHIDQIYLAKTQVFPDGGLGKIEYLTNSGFSANAVNLLPVIAPSNSNEMFTSLPDISYNQALHQYLAIYQTDIGFNKATSTDGINWQQGQQFTSFEKPLSQRTNGDSWIGYPTFLSDSSQNSDGVTDASGNLYFGSGIWPDIAHQLTVRPLEIK